MTIKKRNTPQEPIEPGMIIQATRGDLGEEDVSKPKVTEVVEDQQGKVEKIVVQKGVVFKKTLEIPVDRIEAVEQEARTEEEIPGKVTVEVSTKEAEALTAIGAEEIAPEKQNDLLDSVEQDIPTAEGLREMEASNRSAQAKHTPDQSVDDNDVKTQETNPQHAQIGEQESQAVAGTNPCDLPHRNRE